jgi:two-component SAPR family response regulator
MNVKTLTVLMVVIPASLVEACEQFSGAHVVVETAQTLALAMDLIKEIPFDLIITNSQIEGCGIDLVSAAVMLNPKPTIIGQSYDEYERAMMRQAGCIDVVRPVELRTVVLDQLKRLARAQ